MYGRGTRWRGVETGESDARASKRMHKAEPYATEEYMAVLIDAIDVKKRTLFEFDNTPFCCLEAEVNTPTARGGQTLVRLKIRNLLTNAVFEKTFKAGDKFKEPDLQQVSASYLYSDSNGSHLLGHLREPAVAVEPADPARRMGVP